MSTLQASILAEEDRASQVAEGSEALARKQAELDGLRAALDDAASFLLRCMSDVKAKVVSVIPINEEGYDTEITVLPGTALLPYLDLVDDLATPKNEHCTRPMLCCACLYAMTVLDSYMLLVFLALPVADVLSIIENYLLVQGTLLIRWSLNAQRNPPAACQARDVRHACADAHDNTNDAVKGGVCTMMAVNSGRC